MCCIAFRRVRNWDVSGPFERDWSPSADGAGWNEIFFFITSLKYELNGSGCVGSTPLYRPRLNDRWTVFPLVAIRWWWWWWLSLSRKRNMAYKRACGFFFIKGVFIQTRKRETLLSSHKTKINKNQNKNTSELYI